MAPVDAHVPLVQLYSAQSCTTSRPSMSLRSLKLTTPEIASDL